MLIGDSFGQVKCRFECERVKYLAITLYNQYFNKTFNIDNKFLEG